MEQVIRGEFGELSAETEEIDVTSNLPRQDRNWRYTDAQGHEHHWDDGYPTLRIVVDETYWCEDCRDEHQDEHLECAICGETIQPATVPPPPWREYTQGRTMYTLNGEPISPERAQEIIDAMRQGG